MNDNEVGLDQLPEEAIRVEEALEALGEDSGAMSLSELNGFLAGIITCPEQIPPSEWLPEIWGQEGQEGKSPFETPADVQAFTDKVMAYYNSLIKELGELSFAPIYDMDEETEEVIWEIWTFGFTRAFDLRPESWEAYLESEEEEASEAMMQLIGLIAVAVPDPESEEPLSPEDIEEIQEAAPDMIPYAVTALYHAGKQLH